METKFCNTCQRDLPVDAFSKNSTRKDGRQSNCKECRKKSWKSHYDEKSSYYKERRKDQERRGKERYRNLKNESECVICGEDERCCLDFHHLDPKEKDINLADKKVNFWSDERFYNEVSKCICVCANCHRKIHAGIIEYKPL